MYRYETIEEQIRWARIERSVYLADLVSTAIVALLNGLRRAADVLASGARNEPEGHPHLSRLSVHVQ